MDELIGKELGNYRVEAKIGEGGMAAVFRAYQLSLDRYVALKVLPPSFAAKNPVFVKRFRREAKSVARLHHPHIVPVYDFGIDQDYSYIVMRYVEAAQTLDKYARHLVEIDRKIDLVSQIANALSFAHKNGVIHRDVKPGNILVDDEGWALLSDFGLAKIDEAVSRLTDSGKGIGTAAYMSPEQAQGRDSIDHRTDIYALGVIVYELLTGTIPHDAPTSLGILLKRTTQPPDPPRNFNPAIPPELEQVVLRALAIQPDNRYDSAIDFAKALQAAHGTNKKRGTVDFAALPPTNRSEMLSGRSKAAFGSTMAQVEREGLLSRTLGQVVWLAAIVGTIAVILLLFWGGGAFNSTARQNGLTEPAATSASLLVTSVPTQTLTPTPNPSDTPPLPTATNTQSPPTSTPTLTSAPPTLTPANTPTQTPVLPAVTPMAASTPTPSLPSGIPVLLNPLSLDEPTYGPTDFEWQWVGDIPAGLGFEVRVWQEGEPPAGVHNAIDDNANGRIEQIGADRYRLSVNIKDAAGVRDRTGQYLWTVVLVQIEPSYNDLGRQAPPALLRFEAGGGGSGGGNDSGGGPGGGIS
jgi:serine/threonine-protein kinase